MSPRSVRTSHSPPAVRSIAVTVVFLLISPPPSRAPRARACVRSAGLDVAVLRVADGAEDAVRLDERPDLLQLLRRQPLDLDAADRARDAGVVAVFVEPILRQRDADVGHGPEADVHAGLGAETLVERHRIFVELADRVADIEQRQQARRVPGRAGCQLPALDENAVVPALLHEMIKGRDADDAAADHHHARVRPHGPVLPVGDVELSTLAALPRAVCRPRDGGCRGSVGAAGLSPSRGRRATVRGERERS